MLHAEYTNQFKRDLKLAKKRGKDLTVIRDIMQLILNESTLPSKLKDHSLSGQWHHHRELHLEPDWLLIYSIDKTEKTAFFIRTGTHSDLF